MALPGDEPTTEECAAVIIYYQDKCDRMAQTIVAERERCARLACGLCRNVGAPYIKPAVIRECYNWGITWVHKCQGMDGAWFWSPCKAAAIRAGTEGTAQ